MRELHIWHMIGYLSHADWAGVKLRKSMVSFVTSLPYSVILCITVMDMLVFIHYMSWRWEDIRWNTKALILLENYNQLYTLVHSTNQCGVILIKSQFIKKQPISNQFSLESSGANQIYSNHKIIPIKSQISWK